MDNLIIALNTVVPLFVVMLLGYCLKLMGWISREFITTGNKLSFKIFLPIMLFSNIYKSEIGDVFDGRLLAFAVGATLVVLLLAVLTVPRFVKDPTHSSVMIQGLYRSNYVVLGVPIVTNYYGAGAIGVISLLASVIIPLYNFLAVLLFAYFSPGGHHSMRETLTHIALNPLIIAGLGGLAFSVTGLTLPGILQSSVSDLGRMAIPLALLVLGADFELGKVSKNVAHLAVCVVGRLVVVPLIMLTLALAMGYQGPALLSLVVLFGAPVSVSSYVMACSEGADCDLAGQTVVFTSLFGCVTLVAFIAALTAAGYL